MTRLSRTQCALLVEMAEGNERHIIYDPYGFRTSWVREPGKRQILESTLMILEAHDLLQHRFIPGIDRTAWW